MNEQSKNEEEGWKYLSDTRQTRWDTEATDSSMPSVNAWMDRVIGLGPAARPVKAVMLGCGINSAAATAAGHRAMY